MTLNEIRDGWLAVHDSTDESGELPPEVDDLIAALEQAEPAKLDSCAGLIDQWQMEIAGAQAQIDQWAAKKKTRENKVKALKDRLRDYLISTGRTKAATATGRIMAVQNNGGVTPMVLRDGFPPEDLPERFQKVTVTANVDAIRKALESGDPEADTYARFEARGQHLRIK